jgi:hypothetical protein
MDPVRAKVDKIVLKIFNIKENKQNKMRPIGIEPILEI